GKDHGSLRKDFPGGFPGDERDAFTAAGRTDQENDIFNYLRELLHLRKQHSAFADGKLTHFPPRDGAYVYFRNGKDERLMVAINNHPKAQELPWHHYTHAAPGAKLLRNLRNGETVTLGSDAKITVTGRQAAIFEVLER
ncbi:MAG: cyclomaltodextrinase C-terminal domain-containing protein, partial [Calditrichaeota bacterium]|nr:cyclomaltodextrinase C-terminal domain-containing protein [Calditrichota bacterium]